MHPTRALVAALAAVFSSLPGLAAAENRIDVQRPDAPELAAYGPLDVGVRPLELVNSDQVDVLSVDPDAAADAPVPTYDRPLTLQVWYPSFPGATGDTALRVFLRDGVTEVPIEGRAVAWAAPTTSGGPYPLVIVSHGYPGNRFLLSHLAENLASKGYVVASIDHTDSTYRDQAAFGSTLRNRTLDQLFVLDEMERLSGDSGSFLSGLVDASNAAVVGYSMGGYGAVITAGAGVTEASVGFPFSPPRQLLDVHRSGSDSHAALFDERIRTAVAFAPWGRNTGFFDADTLDGVKIPMLFIAGSADDVSGYEIGTRAIWEESVNVDRSLLTFDNANHNAGAPFPAPQESYEFSPSLGFAPFEHYADAVWDTVRMNNVSQHFATAWLDLYLKGDGAKAPFLELVPDSDDGVYAVDEDGSFTDEHTYWTGFADRTAVGMRFESLDAGERAPADGDVGEGADEGVQQGADEDVDEGVGEGTEGE